MDKIFGSDARLLRNALTKRSGNRRGLPSVVGDEVADALPNIFGEVRHGGF